MDYFQKMKGLAGQLVSAGHPMHEEEIVSYILCGLGSDYDSVVTSVSTRMDPVGLNELYAHLINYELRVEHNERGQQIDHMETLKLIRTTVEEVVADSIRREDGAKGAILEDDSTAMAHDHIAKCLVKWAMMPYAATIDLIIHIRLKIKINLPLLQRHTKLIRTGILIPEQLIT